MRISSCSNVKERPILLQTCSSTFTLTRTNTHFLHAIAVSANTYRNRQVRRRTRWELHWRGRFLLLFLWWPSRFCEGERERENKSARATATALVSSSFVRNPANHGAHSKLYNINTSYILQPSPQKHHIASINKFSRVSRGSCSTCTGEPV